MLNITEFIKYLKSINFPKKNYDATFLYPNTTIIDKKPINEFTKKYKRKFLIINNEAVDTNKEKNILYLNTLTLVSELQKNLLNNNIQSVISGGSTIKLYSSIDNNKNLNSAFLIPADIDMQVFYDDSKTKLTNTINLMNIENIIKFMITKLQNYMFLEFYILLQYKSKKDFDEVLEFYLSNGYDLHLFKQNPEKIIYYFRFLKVINKELCIIIVVKLVDLRIDFKKCNYNSYFRIKTYFFDIHEAYKLKNKYIPLEVVVNRTKKSNIDLIKETITYNNNTYYLLNRHAVLYNLINMYYKYQNLLNNEAIIKKKEEQKNKRDEKRLDYFYYYYCNIFYKDISKDKLEKILKKIKLNNIKFDKCIHSLKNFKVISKFF